MGTISTLNAKYAYRALQGPYTAYLAISGYPVPLGYLPLEKPVSGLTGAHIRQHRGHTMTAPRIQYRRNRRMAKREGLSYRQHKDSPTAEARWSAVRINVDGTETLYPLGAKPGI